MCPYCAKESELTLIEKQIVKEYGLSFKKTKKPVGCPKCNNVGFKGRLPLFEFLEMDNEIRYAVARGASVEEIEKLAREKGFKTLIEDGFDKVKQELTTIEEVIKVSR